MMIGVVGRWSGDGREIVDILVGFQVGRLLEKGIDAQYEPEACPATPSSPPAAAAAATAATTEEPSAVPLAMAAIGARETQGGGDHGAHGARGSRLVEVTRAATTTITP